MNFAIAMQAQFVNLGDDVRCQAAFLTAPRKRHDTVGAELVTAFDDRNKRDIL